MTYIPGGGTTDSDAIHKSTGAEISTVTEKGSPVGADLLLIEDSAASNAKKRVQITNLPAGGEINDLSAAVTWANIPDANVPSTAVTQHVGLLNHNSLLNNHNLTTDIDHDTITNNHNLTTDIDHNTITNNHNLTTDIDHNQLTNYAAGEHRTINDVGTGVTDLWSGSKINTELGGKASSSHTHTNSEITDFAAGVAANETSHSDVLVDGDIGSTVQAHDSVLDNTTASYTTTEETKLSGIETGADVTDTDNVTAAGALMDSEVDADIKTLTLPANTTISTFGASLVDDADNSAARTTLNVDVAGTDNSTDVTLAGTPDYITIAGQVITRNQIDLANDVTGNLAVGNLNSGTGATASTYWCGDGTWKAAGGSTTLEYMVPVWAEENAALGGSNTYEWAFGNGANTPSDGGLTVYVPSGWACTVVAMSLRLGGGTATVELVKNGTPQGANCNVAISSGQSNTEDGFTPVSLSDNDYINFRTTTSSGTSGPCVVTAWLRYVET